LELLTARLFLGLAPLRVLQHLSLLGLPLAELLQALLVLAVIPRLAAADQVHQLRHAPRSIVLSLRDRRSSCDRKAEHCGCNETVDLHPNFPAVGQWVASTIQGSRSRARRAPRGSAAHPSGSAEPTRVCGCPRRRRRHCPA